MKNWVALPNPHSLPSPPVWWLSALADAHPRIVLFPGITEKVYRVGERTERAKALTTSDPSGESARMIKHGCVPLCSLVPWAQWNKDFFEWLDAHDIWALKGTPDGSGKAAADRIEALEAQAAKRRDEQQADEVNQISASAYFGFANRHGSQVVLSGHQK